MSMGAQIPTLALGQSAYAHVRTSRDQTSRDSCTQSRTIILQTDFYRRDCPEPAHSTVLIRAGV